MEEEISNITKMPATASSNCTVHEAHNGLECFVRFNRRNHFCVTRWLLDSVEEARARARECWLGTSMTRTYCSNSSFRQFDNNILFHALVRALVLVDKQQKPNFIGFFSSLFESTETHFCVTVSRVG